MRSLSHTGTSESNQATLQGTLTKLRIPAESKVMPQFSAKRDRWFTTGWTTLNKSLLRVTDFIATTLSLRPEIAKVKRLM